MFGKLSEEKKHAIKSIKKTDEFILVTNDSTGEGTNTQRACEYAMALNTAINMINMIKPIKDFDEFNYNRAKREILKALG